MPSVMASAHAPSPARDDPAMRLLHDIIALVVAGSHLGPSFPQSTPFRRRPASIPVEPAVECEADDKFSCWAQALAGPKDRGQERRCQVLRGSYHQASGWL